MLDDRQVVILVGVLLFCLVVFVEQPSLGQLLFPASTTTIGSLSSVSYFTFPAAFSSFYSEYSYGTYGGGVAVTTTFGYMAVTNMSTSFLTRGGSVTSWVSSLRTLKDYTWTYTVASTTSVSSASSSVVYPTYTMLPVNSPTCEVAGYDVNGQLVAYLCEPSGSQPPGVFNDMYGGVHTIVFNYNNAPVRVPGFCNLTPPAAIAYGPYTWPDKSSGFMYDVGNDTRQFGVGPGAITVHGWMANGWQALADKYTYNAVAGTPGNVATLINFAVLGDTAPGSLPGAYWSYYYHMPQIYELAFLTTPYGCPIPLNGSGGFSFIPVDLQVGWLSLTVTQRLLVVIGAIAVVCYCLAKRR